MEDSFLREITEPLFFNTQEFGKTLERYAEDNPHQRVETLTGDTSPAVNVALYDTSRAQPELINATYLGDYPDISDEIMTDYKFRKLMGEDVAVPMFVDLDTAEDYVQFTKNTAGGILASETEFDTGPAELASR